jgi:hypothetical protein
MKWKKSTITVLLGDRSWPRHDFRPFFVGRLKPPKAGHDTIIFDLGELAEIFTDQLQANVFAGGAGLNFEGEYKPLAIGRPLFVEPPLFDSTNNKYKLHDGSNHGRNADLDIRRCSAGHGRRKLPFERDRQGDRRRRHRDRPACDREPRRQCEFRAGADLGGALRRHGPQHALLRDHGGRREPRGDLYNARGREAQSHVIGRGGAVQVHNFDIDPTLGELTLINAATGRIVVSKVEPDLALVNIATMIEWVVFTKFGLSTSYKDLDSITALQSLMSDDGYDAGIWIDRKGSAVAAALEQITNRSNTWINQAPDGVLEVGRIDLPESAAAYSFTDGDVAEGSLEQTPCILPIDFTQTRTRYRPVWLTGGPYFVAGVEAASLLEPVYSYGSSGTPIDTAPQGDTQPKTEFDTIFEDGTLEQARLATLFAKALGVFSFSTHLGALRVRLGQTIELVHPRKGWKVYTASDAPSPDNPAAFDATKAVVIAKEVNLAATNPLEKVKLTVFRQIPQYAPEYADDMPDFNFLFDAREGSLTAEDGTVGALTRATVAWEFDHEGLVRQVKSGEARFRGWRREENLAPDSADFSVAGWTKTTMTVGGDKQTLTATAGNAEITAGYAIPATLGAGDYRPRFKITRLGGTGNIQIRMGGVYTTVAVGASPVSFTAPVAAAATGTLTWGIRIVTNGDSIKVEYAGLHDVSGRAIQLPPEEVATATNYGVGVVGVRIFRTLNGTTVASNAITDAVGALISEATRKHLHLEANAATNRITAPRDLTNAAWTKTNVTAARATGLDGRGNSGSSITATAGNGTCLQALAVLGAAQTRKFSVYAKRLVGTGTLEMTMDNGATWTVITPATGAGFVRAMVGRNATTNTVGFRIATNADSFAIDFGLEELRTDGASSPLDTTVAATRNADALTFTSTTLDKAQGALFAEFAPDQDGAGASTMYPVATDTPNEVGIRAGAQIYGYLGANQAAIDPAPTWVDRQMVKRGAPLERCARRPLAKWHRRRGGCGLGPGGQQHHALCGQQP